MKQHTGMKPHDLIILCAVILQKNDDLFMKDLAHQLNLSQSEISEALIYKKLPKSEDRFLLEEMNLPNTKNPFF